MSCRLLHTMHTASSFVSSISVCHVSKCQFSSQFQLICRFRVVTVTKLRYDGGKITQDLQWKQFVYTDYRISFFGSLTPKLGQLQFYFEFKNSEHKSYMLVILKKCLFIACVTCVILRLIFKTFQDNIVPFHHNRRNRVAFYIHTQKKYRSPCVKYDLQ